MRRNALDICEQLLAVVPDKEREFQKALISLRESMRFRAPEMEQLSWEQLSAVFNTYILREWQKDAIEVFTTKRP